MSKKRENYYEIKKVTKYSWEICEERSLLFGFRVTEIIETCLSKKNAKKNRNWRSKTIFQLLRVNLSKLFTLQLRNKISLNLTINFNI